MKKCLYICIAKQSKQNLSIHTTSQYKRRCSTSQTLFGSCLAAKKKGQRSFLYIH